MYGEFFYVFLFFGLLYYFSFKVHSLKKELESKDNTDNIIELKRKKNILEKEIYELTRQKTTLDLITTSLKISKNIPISSPSTAQSTILSLQENISTLQKKIDELEHFVNEKQQSYPWLSNFYADYLYTYDEKISDH